MGQYVPECTRREARSRMWETGNCLFPAGADSRARFRTEVVATRRFVAWGPALLPLKLSSLSMGRKKARGGVFRRVLVFDEEKRREYLTGFHKRKLERRKTAVEELKKKIKEEQRKMREERHKEYVQMLKEREEALEEADELERLVTSKTESVQYDHPNHTVTVTTISDLDLSGVGLLGLGEGEGQDVKEDEKLTGKTAVSLPKRAGDPILSKKISTLMASLHAHSKKKSKGRKPSCFLDKTKKPLKGKVGKTSKTQRRKLTGKAERNRE